MRFKRQWGGHLKFDNQVLLQSQVKKWYKGENETHWKRLLYKSDKGIISFTQRGFKMKRTQSAYCSSFVTVMCHWCWTSQTCHYGSTQSFFLPTKSNTHPLFTNCHLCYVRAERSARLELEGYDLAVWLVVNEASASGTRWEHSDCGNKDDTWWRGRGRYPRRTRCSGESVGSAQLSSIDTRTQT